MVDAAQVSENETVRVIAARWRAAGRMAPMAVSPNLRRPCSLQGCMMPAWVEVKTTSGLCALCYPHFRAIENAKVS